MAPLFSLTGSLLLSLAAHSYAHFNLNYPQTAGFDDGKQATGPCGSFSIDKNTNATDFHVGGDVISVTSGHPQTTYLIRVTPDTAVAGNFTQLLPALQQSGLGQFCEPSVAVPATFAGSKGVLQIIADSPDGLLYQCALLNFVSGAGQGAATANADCKNATGVSGSYVADATLSAAATAGPTAGTESGSASASATKSASGSTASAKSAAGMGARSRLDAAAPLLAFAGVASVAALLTLL